MPDITMCHANDGNDGMCPLRKECYRYMATPHTIHQSYFLEAPYVMVAQGDGFTYKCEQLIPYNDVDDKA